MNPFSLPSAADLARTAPGSALIEALSFLPDALRHRVLRDRIWILREMHERPHSPYSTRAMYELEAIFLHVPKTGGLSVARALFGDRGALHLTPEHCKLIFGHRRFRRFFKFAFVRNPYDRTVSSWAYLRQGGIQRWESPWIQRHVTPHETFAAFVRSELVRREVQRELHFRPQARFLTNHRGHVVPDFVGRFERLEPDFVRLAARLGVDAKLPRTNTSRRRRDYREYYDDAAARIVRDVYRDDFDTFEYSREL